MIEKLIKKPMYWIEAIIALVLILLTVMAIGQVVVEVYHLAVNGFVLGHDKFSGIMASVLDVFILVELFAIALAYMQHKNIVPVVLEAALVAIARKMVIFSPKGNVFEYSLGLSALLLAVGLTWYFLSRADALCDAADSFLDMLGIKDKNSKDNEDSIHPEL